MKTVTNQQLAIKVSFVTIIGNIVLTIFKMFAGIVSGSAAMVSDAVHSGSDVLSTVVVIIGVRLSNKKSDSDHQYGHERLECVAALILAVMLGITGVGIGLSGVERITSGNYSRIAVPGLLALVAAILSVILKEVMYWYTRAAAKKINSGALMADAWHHRSDSLSSVGSFAGILGARMGFPVLDSVASVVISAFIIKVAIEIFRDAIKKMTDRACDEETVAKIKELVASQEGVLQVDLIKTRLFGDKIYVDIEISADGNISLNDSHNIAQSVHDAMENTFPLVKHCMVHVNPYNHNL